MTALLYNTRFRIVALVLAAFAVAALFVFLNAASASAHTVDSTWYYVCRWTTEWWDPFNWFGTGKTRCFNEWR